jgi:hypothetical protein
MHVMTSLMDDMHATTFFIFLYFSFFLTSLFIFRWIDCIISLPIINTNYRTKLSI